MSQFLAYLLPLLPSSNSYPRIFPTADVLHLGSCRKRSLLFLPKLLIRRLREGQHEKAKNLIQSLLKSRFGVLDEELSLIVEPLTQMPDDEVASLLLTSSREELVTRFGL